jgi:uncharacterized protein (DUF488 family)
VAEQIAVYTIGHSNHSSDTFLALLREHGIQAVVDVRSAPYSQFAPHFNRPSLSRMLGKEGIQYLFAGKVLGGRPTDPACYLAGVVPERKADYLTLVDYPTVARQEWYRRGVRRLLDIAAEQVTAVMCSEEDPRRCHRYHLIEPSLSEEGIELRHIRRNGAIESIGTIDTEASSAGVEQLALIEF